MTSHTSCRPALRWLAAAAVAASPGLSHALDGITDPAGDFLATFAGSSASTDLDVLSATVTYNPTADIFTLSSTMAGPVGLTPGGFYVWGVNRGTGTAGFAANGLIGVLFDTVVLLRPNGTGTAAGTALPAGAISVVGNTISASFSGALLPSTGFAKANYTFNLWPRDGAFTGFAAISDFAPNNANFTATPVPEPARMGLMALGLGLLAWRVRAARG
jgi:hypothetical protein